MWIYDLENGVLRNNYMKKSLTTTVTFTVMAFDKSDFILCLIYSVNALAVDDVMYWKREIMWRFLLSSFIDNQYSRNDQSFICVVKTAIQFVNIAKPSIIHNFIYVKIFSDEENIL